MSPFSCRFKGKFPGATELLKGPVLRTEYSKRKFIKPIFDTSFRLYGRFLVKGTYFANGKHASLIKFTSAKFFLTI